MRLLPVLALVLVGCAQYWVSDYMQPDGSYRITVNGNGFGDDDGADAMARAHAAQLCPNGFEEQNDFELAHAPMHAARQITVKCDGAE